jgi:hypothetical protein
MGISSGLLHALAVLAVSTISVDRAQAEVEYVIAISVDGGRGDFIKTFIDTAPTEFPNFKRLRDMSAATFNARTDYTESITIPAHLCMLTGRPVRLPTGLTARVHHGIALDAPSSTETVHNSGLNSGLYKASIFDVVHDRGLSTALYMGKARLQICGRSWDAANGALDVTGMDDGRNKIDSATIMEASGTSATSTMLATFVGSIATSTLKNFTIFHIADTDYAGHSGGWSTTVGSPYRNTMKTADGWLGQILDALQANAALTGKVAIILTADHGGGSPPINHTDATIAANYTVPFLVAAPGVTGGSNIYDYFENRFDAQTSRPNYTDLAQPMRNGDVANLSAALLGVPTVPGSLMVPEFKKPLSIVRNNEVIRLSWPAYLTGYTLEWTDDLTAGPWTTVMQGIVESEGQNAYLISTPPPSRFFRLRKPSAPAAVGAATASTQSSLGTTAPVSVTSTNSKEVRKDRGATRPGKANRR